MAVKISIRPNGPYLVEGEVELVDVNGNKVDTSGKGPRFALCRCGGSVTKPFCGGTHSKIGFHAPEAAAAQGKKKRPANLGPGEGQAPPGGVTPRAGGPSSPRRGT